MIENLNILELSNVLAGPAVGMFFSELGANVIKVENKLSGGDMTRKWKLPSEKSQNISAYFGAVNYGKKHVFLDFTNKDDRKTLESYIKNCDIIITNFKYGDAEKYKLSFENCKSINPSVIYAHIGGFKSNPKRVAFDVVLQAETGFLSMTGTSSQTAKIPVALIDVLAAHQIKEGILLALLKREKTKKAYEIKTTLEESAISSLMNQSSNFLMANHVAQPMGTLHPNIAPYGDIIISKEGDKLVLAIGTDLQFDKFCSIIEMEKNNSFIYNQSRVNNRLELMELINKRTKNISTEALLSKCQLFNIPIGKIKSIDEVLQSKLAKNMILKEEVNGHETMRIKTNAFELSS